MVMMVLHTMGFLDVFSDGSKKHQRWLMAIGIVAIILLASLAYWQLSTGKDEKSIPQKKIDDRISPLENQGLVFEINRMRNRGLLDRLMEPGLSWRETPRFYFISTMDGLEYISKDVRALGSATEIFFETWDTIFNENKVVRDVDEENETAQVSLAIMERQTSGVLGRTTEDIEKDRFDVEYDFRTGRWTGDDFFMDSDGYGHYMGDNFEIWFNLYQTDYDNDGIPYWTEVNVLETNPRIDDSFLDPDRDGIPTSWEWRWGYDPCEWDDHQALDPDIDGIENVEEYQMARWFADPFRPDIYMEIDNMEPSPMGVQHNFWNESQQALIEQFARHGINIYIDNGWPDGPTNGGGELVTYYKTVSQDSGMMLQYYNNHFDDQRKGIFRYFVIGHSGAFTHPSKFFRYDTTHVATSLFERLVYQHLYYLIGMPIQQRLDLEHPYYWHLPTPRTQRITVAGQFMHELGHQLGITPWTIQGCDNYSSLATGAELQEFVDEWGNYYSVMNYYWLYRDKTLLDYSDGTHGENDQNDWQEIYLPNFQMEGAPIIEDDAYNPPMIYKLINESRGFDSPGWTHNQSLTERFAKSSTDYTPITPIQMNWLVYEKDSETKQINNCTIRVYGQPIYSSTIVPDSEWTLVSEGFLDENKEFHFTSSFNELFAMSD
jgi:hypothetical protein